MSMDRRDFMAAGAALVSAAAAAPQAAQAASGKGATARHRRIAIEEAWSIPEHLDALAALATGEWDNLDVQMIDTAGSKSQGATSKNLMDTEARLAEMDRLGVDMQILSLTSPGVQLFRKGPAVDLARLANDRLAEIVRARPTRFGGLASFAPQDPAAAAKEMERAINELKLHGFVVNSHTHNEYLDDPKFWPILEAAEALDRPIYIHPRAPSDGWSHVIGGSHMQAAIWGFAVETGSHAVRMMLNGVFDRFPKLKIIIGHMGENLPFHLWRTDYWYERRRDSYASKLKPSEIMKRNFFITNSGVEHGPALKYSIDVLGADRVLWAIDYPYQPMKPAVDFINSVDISEENRALILHKNAEKLFSIPTART